MGVKVRKRDGAWWVFVDHRSVRKARRVGEKKAAEQVAIKIQAKLADGDITAIWQSHRNARTFAAYGDTWLADYAAKMLKPATHRFYEMNLRLHINPALGAMPVSSIRRRDCRDVLNA